MMAMMTMTPQVTRVRSDLSISVLQPKLTMAKCRRNVENFLDACRRIGVPQVTSTPALMIILNLYGLMKGEVDDMMKHVCRASWELSSE